MREIESQFGAGPSVKQTTSVDEIPDSTLKTPGDVTDRIKNRSDIPGGVSGPFFQELGQRKKNGRDAKVLVTAKDGATGVGKSNLCDFLGYVSDTTADGFATHKITIEPMRFLELYSVLEPGSAAVMEEGEQFDSRRGMTAQNVEATQKWQQARVREIIAYVNLPDPTMIDGRFERLADYWINVERRGRCRIYKKRIHPTKRVIYYETLQTLEWPNMDGSETFEYMDEIKGDLLDGKTDKDSLLRRSEADKEKKRAVEKAERETRDHFIRSLYGNTDLTASDIASLDAVDVKASRVRQIGNS